MILKRLNKIYFIGIKGVGTAALAVLLKEKGYQVAGSDVNFDFGTDEMLRKSKIRIYRGFKKNNLDQFVAGSSKTLVIATGAHKGLANIESVYAKKRGIKVLTYGEALGRFMEEKKQISVAGSHGKTTTAAIISHLLFYSKYDPSYIIGCSAVKTLFRTGHYGLGDYFIAEADEYVSDPKYDLTPKFHYQKPTIAVVLNVDFDHPDVYKSKEEVISAFCGFVKKIKKHGFLVICGDNPKIKKVIKSTKSKVFTYGFSKSNDFIISNIYCKEKNTFFEIEKAGKKIGPFSLSLFGRQNVVNATASIIVAGIVGLSWTDVKILLPKFKGIKRRLEFIKKTKKGALIFDDYAHHPVQIREVFNALKNNFPKKRLVCVFQPHTVSRTKTFFKQFVESLSLFDLIVLTKIYPSAREKMDKSVSSKLMAGELRKQKKEVYYSHSFKKAAQILEEKVHFNDIIVTMGAGDIFRLYSFLH